MKESKDEIFLKKCFSLAKNGCGLVSPNPMVGAIVVKGNHIIGSGWHKAYGLAHAEIEALNMAGKKAKGATLYINLEPCCHYGKTPPCTDAIMKAGIKKVVFSTIDPNPLVNGRSVAILENNGISVRYGLLEKQASTLNEAYFTYIKNKRPFISLKWAMSIDGKIANEKGQSQWITSDEARRYNKKIRFEYDAILTGINTILKDNSLFNYSVPGYAVKKQLLNHKRYYKILLDSYLRVPPSSNFFSPPTRLIIFTKKGINLKNRQYGNNVDIVEVNETQPGLLDITEVIRYLYNIGVGKLFVEGGTKILTSFYNLTLFDKIYMFMGTKIIGGDAVYPPVKGHLIPLDSPSFLSIKNVIRFSNDILIVLKNVLGNN